MTYVNFIIEERMLRNKNLYESRLFTNKENCNIVWGRKGKYRVVLIKSLLNEGVKEALEGHTIKDLKEIGQSDKKI